jgi:two-component system OmpR family sensor kinase
MREQLRRTRVRLTLVYVALFALVAGSAALAFWVAFSVTEYQAIDNSLTTQAHEIGGQGFNDKSEPLPGETATGIGIAAVLLGPDGRVIDHSGQIKDPAGFAATAGRAIPAGGCCETKTVGGQPMRLLVMPVDLGAGGRGRLVLARPVAEVQESLLRVAVLLAVVVVLLVAGAGGLGYWLSGRALRPVRVMAATARQISEQDLHRRIALDLPPGDELGDLAATFDGMLARLEAAFEGLRRFTADAAHEFRAPLALMRTQVDVMLRRRRSAEEYEASHRSLLTEIERLGRLADQLLLLARADAGALASRREAIDLPEFLEETIERWRPAAQERDVALESQLPLEGEVGGDPDLLRQLMDNLLDNAIRHNPRRGTIAVSAVENNGWWQLAVQDSGSGISPELRPRLFSRFARADAARGRSTGGAGLGLSLCAAIAEAHGGYISLDDRSGGGARFVVRLPRKPSGAAERI